MHGQKSIKFSDAKQVYEYKKNPTEDEHIVAQTM
jgi:hypothetical protein